LPLYPDDKDIIFNEEFLNKSNNILREILPEFSHLSDIIKVIDVPKSTNGLILRVLLNADLEEAAAILGTPSQTQPAIKGAKIEPPEPSSEEHWRWRFRMAERIAAQLDAERFGVKGFYLLGSTKNAMATSKSDIDLLIHFGGTSEQKDELMIWLEGWSKCLAEINYLRTGYKSEGLLDIYLVTDEDISNRSGYAAKIGAVTDAARQLPLKKIEATRS
jgi:predicted nucleotidyltransferase